MSIAWSTVALLVLLLPGFLFFIGLYLPEDFTRETAARSTLGQLAGTVVVALLIHGASYSLSHTLQLEWLPAINLGVLLQLLQVEKLSPGDFNAAVSNVLEYRWWILGYLITSGLVGLWLGYEFGSLIVAGPLRRLAEHSWVFNLKVEGGSDRAPGLVRRAASWLAGYRRRESWLPTIFGQAWAERYAVTSPRTVTVAYVVSDVSHEEKYVIYRGILKSFGVSKEGKPLYLVLSETLKSYLELSDVPRTRPGPEWYRIGGSPRQPTDLGPKRSSYFVISGDHITNLVFDRHVYLESPGGLQAVDAALRTERERRQALSATAADSVVVSESTTATVTRSKPST